MAAIGGFALLAKRMRWAQVAAGLALAVMIGGVLVSDSLGYRVATLAPPERLDAMTDAAAHATGGGLWLVDEWEEFAKYFMRDIKVNAAFEAESPRPAELRKPRPIFGRYYDLDALTLEYVNSFPGIIKRRSPAASRPPASFKLSYENDYYEVWRQQEGPAVIEHLPLQRRHDAAARPPCDRIRALAARARPGDRLVAASRPEVVLLDPLHAGLRPKGWIPNVDPPGTVTPLTPGEMAFAPRTTGGRFRVWIRGSFGRPRPRTSMAARWETPTRSTRPDSGSSVGEVTLAKGTHRVKLERPGASPAPGNSWRGVIGPVALEPVGPGRLITVKPAARGAPVRARLGLDRAGATVTDQIRGSSLEATGERLVPELQHGELVHAEHLARYRLAAELADSRRVLDAACGEGYGTSMLAASGARSATGIDLDEHAVAHAQAAYPRAKFVTGDVRRLPFDDSTFDLVVSFETIEHVRDPQCGLGRVRAGADRRRMAADLHTQQA